MIGSRKIAEQNTRSMLYVCMYEYTDIDRDSSGKENIERHADGGISGKLYM